MGQERVDRNILKRVRTTEKKKKSKFESYPEALPEYMAIGWITSEVKIDINGERYFFITQMCPESPDNTAPPIFYANFSLKATLIRVGKKKLIWDFTDHSGPISRGQAVFYQYDPEKSVNLPARPSVVNWMPLSVYEQQDYRQLTPIKKEKYQQLL